jgi:hypothetical protein
VIISYCTTCMGRTWQLRQVLPVHLTECRDRTDVEFVLLDYNSDDGLEHWIQNQYDRWLPCSGAGFLGPIRGGCSQAFVFSPASFHASSGSGS